MTLRLLLCLCLPLVIHGFHQQQPSLRHHQNFYATLATKEIDISDILAEADSALEMASSLLPSSEIDQERADITKMHQDIMEDQTSKLTQPPGEKGEQDLLALALASVVTEVSTQVNTAVEFTKEQMEEEEDITKVPGKVIWKVGEKADENLKEFRSSQDQFVEDFKVGKAWSNFVTFLGSDQVKEASGNAIDVSGKVLLAVKRGLESDEFKAMQTKTAQAIKDGLESEEFQQLQNKASAAIQENLSSTPSSTPEPKSEKVVQN